MRARAVVVGGLLVVVALWFAFGGSADGASPHLLVMTAHRELALVLTGLGLLLLGALLGFTIGRRGRSRSSG